MEPLKLRFSKIEENRRRTGDFVECEGDGVRSGGTDGDGE